MLDMSPLWRIAARVYDRLTIGPEFVRFRFGTARGLVRLCLSRFGHWRGGYADFEQIDWKRVSRLVFVCRGNICRSPYGEWCARSHGLPAHSFGLRAVAGGRADAQAQLAAQRRGVSLQQHRVRSVTDFVGQAGDLLIAMEPGQARELQARFGRQRGVQVTLLGLWSRPRRPHLYDPKDMPDRYFDTAFGVIDDAIVRMQSLVAMQYAK